MQGSSRVHPGIPDAQSWAPLCFLDRNNSGKTQQQTNGAGEQGGELACGGCKCFNGWAGCRETADRCRMCLCFPMLRSQNQKEQTRRFKKRRLIVQIGRY